MGTRPNAEAAERRRFAIALAGIATSLAISTAIVFMPSPPPAPAPLPVSRAPAMPAALDAPARVPNVPETPRVSAGTRSRPRVLPSSMRARPHGVAAAHAAYAPPPGHALSSGSNAHSGEAQPSGRPLPTRALAVWQAPEPVRSSSVAVPSRAAAARRAARGHGAVTGALVTAGAHVSDGFRTVGRVLRRVF